jgi:hypothetical protein
MRPLHRQSALRNMLCESIIHLYIYVIRTKHMRIGLQQLRVLKHRRIGLQQLRVLILAGYDGLV